MINQVANQTPQVYSSDPPQKKAESTSEKASQTPVVLENDKVQTESQTSKQGTVPAIDLTTEEPSTKIRSVTERKGTLSVGWGYGWQHFGPSDIHFQGAGHDFTLHGVRAHDRPSPFSFDVYFNPSKLSIPQYMLNLDYFVSDKVFIRAGQHHMKYVMDKDQMAPISGTIDPSTGSPAAGTYNGEHILVTDVVQQLEHTDGLNDVHAGVGIIHPFWESKNGKHAFSMTGAATVGMVVPKSDVRLFGEGENHAFKVAGYSVSAATGLRVDFFRHFFASANMNVGHINLTNFTTSGNEGDKGSQKINYINHYFTLGVNVPINTKSK